MKNFKKGVTLFLYSFMLRFVPQGMISSCFTASITLFHEIQLVGFIFLLEYSVNNSLFEKCNNLENKIYKFTCVCGIKKLFSFLLFFYNMLLKRF